ncbi:hypothetical protein C8046_14230 [Serinibacter arcticus]|uniref:Uncharacterized protein n=1 Tax=Serinibacter arcticus TaxID=1655435 RepID=A0A2U1ZXB8_9MICO|nr:hypothetical protein [Serinibacter arcticus]PWD51628.1 hypothetical protein C8046_14230 [Serinibacter arcticus]
MPPTTPRRLALTVIAASCLGLVLGALLHTAGTHQSENALLWSLAGLTLGTGLLAAGAKERTPRPSGGQVARGARSSLAPARPSARGHHGSMTSGPIAVNDVSTLGARLEFGDSGVGAWPADGTLTLSDGSSVVWEGPMSDAAMRTAEAVWTTRARARSLTGSEKRAVLEAAVNSEASRLGLHPRWSTASVDVDDLTASASLSVSDASTDLMARPPLRHRNGPAR